MCLPSVVDVNQRRNQRHFNNSATHCCASKSSKRSRGPQQRCCWLLLLLKLMVLSSWHRVNGQLQWNVCICMRASEARPVDGNCSDFTGTFSLCFLFLLQHLHHTNARLLLGGYSSVNGNCQQPSFLLILDPCALHNCNLHRAIESACLFASFTAAAIYLHLVGA